LTQQSKSAARRLQTAADFIVIVIVIVIAHLRLVVARQYCGMLGKQDNCQVAVSVSLARDQGNLPVAWQLYLPEEWASDPESRRKAGVPEQVRFATKTQIARRSR
jgi:SRSO17 transposase